jgi:hypothetical protein
MSRTSIVAILAGAGIVFSGALTVDAVAFARAVQTSDETQLLRFAKQFPESVYKSEALKLADLRCTGNWEHAGCTTPPRGNSSEEDKSNRQNNQQKGREEYAS